MTSSNRWNRTRRHRRDRDALSLVGGKVPGSLPFKPSTSARQRKKDAAEHLKYHPLLTDHNSSKQNHPASFLRPQTTPAGSCGPRTPQLASAAIGTLAWDRSSLRPRSKHGVHHLGASGVGQALKEQKTWPPNDTEYAREYPEVRTDCAERQPG